MNTLFAFPHNAAFGRIVAKEVIYRHSNLTAKVKDLFVRQIERITWQYKLAPETINIPSTPAVPEIQVFSIQLRQEECAPEILAAIDEAVKFPILFELCYQESMQYAIAWKRPANASAASITHEKWIVSAHFFGPRHANDSLRVPLPQALSLETLYTVLLRPLLPFEARNDETLASHISRIEAIQKLQEEILRGEEKLKREKQFNKKIEMNKKIRSMKNQRTELMG